MRSKPNFSIVSAKVVLQLVVSVMFALIPINKGWLFPYGFIAAFFIIARFIDPYITHGTISTALTDTPAISQLVGVGMLALAVLSILFWIRYRRRKILEDLASYSKGQVIALMAVFFTLELLSVMFGMIFTVFDLFAARNDVVASEAFRAASDQALIFSVIVSILASAIIREGLAGAILHDASVKTCRKIKTRIKHRT